MFLIRRGGYYYEKGTLDTIYIIGIQDANKLSFIRNLYECDFTITIISLKYLVIFKVN